jgi:hypothetical protein
VKKILQRRGMKLDTKCCMCGRLDEDGGHLFLKCKEAKCIWWELNLEMVGCHLLLAESARAMMEEILKLEPKTQLAVVLLLWLWWSERNKWREEGRRRTAVEVDQTALSDRFLQQTSKVLLSETRQVQRWTKPSPGIFKINSDGAYDSKTGHGGWGFIIRDDQGAMVKAGAGKKKFLQNAFHAELLVCLAGVKMASTLGLQQVVLETDASLVKMAPEGEEYRLSALSGIITEI